MIGEMKKESDKMGSDNEFERERNKKIATEAEAIDQACKLQNRLCLRMELKIDLLNGSPDAVIIVFNRILEEIDSLACDNHKNLGEKENETA